MVVLKWQDGKFFILIKVLVSKHSFFYNVYLYTVSYKLSIITGRVNGETI